MNTHVLDLREELRNGGSPFARIMTAAKAVRNGDSLVLLTPFEPVPLYTVLGKLGFSHTSTPGELGEWEVRFVRKAVGEAAVSPAPSQRPPVAVTRFVEIDARGLQPPQPLVTILEALSDLADDAGLRARTDRRPMHLYPQLEERGFSGETEEQADGSFITTICRR